MLLKSKFSTIILKVLLLLFIFVIPSTKAINCYSGNQLQIIECSSLSCIKQTLGLDTVRYCDGQGASSICQTYRIIDTCQNIPNIGLICCCSDHLCNSAIKPQVFAGIALAAGLTIILASGFHRIF